MMGCFWILLAALFLTSPLTNADKCLKDLPEVNPKRYMIVEGYKYQAKTLPITIDVSQRITHQITSYIFKIFLEEELGYKDVNIMETKNNFIDTKEVLRRLSSGVGKADRPPEAILNTEVWVSPEGDSVSWYDEHRIKECGPIGPPGRFGWFIPNVLLYNKSYESYWKTFTQPVVERFAFDQSEMDYLQKYSRVSDTSYYCEEEYCINGIYTPPACQNQKCAMLLAGYLNSTEFVVSHIQKLQLLVRVIWVGPHLTDVVSNLTIRLTNTPRSLVFLSFTPSALVLPNDPAFSSITFPFCEEFASETGCKYDLHTLVKLYATMFERGAPPAYEAYKRISFDQDQYRQMLHMYRSAFNGSRDRAEAVKQAACHWLRENSHIRNQWKVKQENKTTLYIEGIFPINAGRKVASYDVSSIIIAAQEAQQAVNLNDSVLRDYRLEVQVQDGRCEADFVLKAFIDQIFQQRYNQLVGILGPACSNTLEPLAGVSQHYRTVVVSYSAEGSSFSDRKKFPYFFRTIGENKQYQQVYLQLLSKLNWRRLAALTEDGQKYTEYLTHLQDLLSTHNFTFVTNRKFPTQRDKQAMRNYLEEMKSKSVRIIIGDVYDDAARDMMCQAYKLQMTALQSYVWFLPAWLAPNWYDTDFYNQDAVAAESVPCTTQEMIEAINGHLSLSHAAWAPDNTIMETNQTVKEWRDKFQAHSTNKTNLSVSSYAGYAYDAVWMFALALEQLSKEDPSALSNIHSPETTKQFVKILEKTDFNGVSGRIQFRGNTRISVVEVRQWIDNQTSVVGIFEPNVSISNKDPLAGMLYLNESKIVWLNPDKTRPKDGTVHCFLGLADYFGIEDCTLFLAISNIIGFCILGTVLIIGFLVVKSRYDKKFKLTQEIMNSIGLDLLNVGSLEKWEIPRDKVVINRKLGEGAFGNVYGGEAYFDSKGWVAVAVKTLKVGSTPEEKLEFLCEAEVMKRFDHPNIIKLMGVCAKNEPVYTVMEFMLYGDMKTFLLARRHLVNEKLGEDADEVSSKKLTTMALDVARALSYLAELKFVHRDVASRNCLVNAARVVKLGDFGMTRPTFDKDYYRFTRKGMLPVRWMSPESLALGLFTPASDVWSFGVLLYEIITFGSFPFQGMNNYEVLEHVKAGNTLPIPSKVKPQAEALIRSCWTLDYKKRPKASEIVEFIANNPRLVQPCLDVPLASVQIDDSGSVDILQSERDRKFSFSLRNRNGSGVFNSPSQWPNGVVTPPLWSQEEDESNSPSHLSPVGEEDLPEWDMPLLDRTNMYVVVPNEYSQFNATPQVSLL